MRVYEERGIGGQVGSREKGRLKCTWLSVCPCGGSLQV